MLKRSESLLGSMMLKKELWYGGNMLCPLVLEGGNKKF